MCNYFAVSSSVSFRLILFFCLTCSHICLLHNFSHLDGRRFTSEISSEAVLPFFIWFNTLNGITNCSCLRYTWNIRFIANNIDAMTHLKSTSSVIEAERQKLDEILRKKEKLIFRSYCQKRRLHQVGTEWRKDYSYEISYRLHISLYYINRS